MTYGQRIRYRRPPNAYLRAQWLGFLLTKLGISPRYVVTLEVPGRQSGIIRRTTPARVGYDGADYLMALAGESEGFRNVRAAGGRVVIGRTDRRAATPVEVPPQDRPAILRAYLQRSGRRPGSRAVTNEARSYPVFRIIEGEWPRTPVPTQPVQTPPGSTAEQLLDEGRDGGDDRSGPWLGPMAMERMLAGVDPAGSDPTQGCVIWRMQSRQQGAKVIHVKDAGLRGCPSEFGGAAAVIDERSKGFCG